MGQKDRWSNELLIFRQVDRVNKTISGDLNEATFEDMMDYMHKVRNSIMALEALVSEELKENGDYDKPELESNRYTEPDLAEIFQHLMERYRRVMNVINEENILGQEKMVVEDPV